MARKRHATEQIIAELRGSEVLIAQGGTVPEACRHIDVTEQTYYRWRKDHNEVRPHGSLGNHAPARFAALHQDPENAENSHPDRT